MTLFLITAPSGAGKTTLAKQTQNAGMWVECISHTTRPKRKGEVEGETYYFLDEEGFDSMLNVGSFAENVVYGGNKYAISHIEIEEKMSNHGNVFIIVDYNGYTQVKDLYPDAVGIFLYMSKEDCLANMLLRGDSMEDALSRIDTYDSEIDNSIAFEYVVKNVRNKQNNTVDILKGIISQYNDGLYIQTGNITTSTLGKLQNSGFIKK